MTETYNDLHRAQNEVSASSAGGAPFLICYGLTFIITGILAFNLPKETYAYILLLVGIAYWVAAPLVYRHAKAIVTANPQ